MTDHRPMISEHNARNLSPEMRAKYRVVAACGYCWEDDRNEACPDHGYEARQIQRIDTLEAENARLRAALVAARWRVHHEICGTVGYDAAGNWREGETHEKDCDAITEALK